MTNYKEIFRLKEMLELDCIPFEFLNLFDGYQIRYPDYTYNNNYICSVIEHNFSYGNTHDLLELSGLLTREEESLDSVVGYLSAEEVFERIKRHWFKYEDIMKGDVY